MYKRILVAIDDSRMAQAALREALELAKAQAADVRIVHVIESPYGYPESWYTDVHTDLEALRRIWRQAGLRVLEQATALARETGVAVETVLLELDGQRMSRVIVDDAARWGADLVVVGTHGRHGIEHLLLGSVAEAVARTAPGSVLLVRGGASRA
jgi:nucleotide-binding universal stress UspA family protein